MPQFSDIHPQSPVSLKCDKQPTAVLQPLHEIRVAISILFYFLRRTIPDKVRKHIAFALILLFKHIYTQVFSNAIKDWLTKLVSYLLRTATWQDHLFLIYHVLRCPAGVSGWASGFIQIPKPNQNVSLSPFSSNEIHHCIAFLRTLLLPINGRHEFLAEYRNGKNVGTIGDDLWILVDSDGDEESSEASMPLREQDLISFLNQIPLESIFR